MKIAMMTNNYKPFIGGVPISVERLSEGLAALGHEVWVFAPEYEEEHDLNKPGTVHEVRYRVHRKRMENGMVVPGIFDEHIREAFEQENFDLIHVHQPMLMGNVARHYSRRYQIPLVFTWHTRYEEYLHYLKLLSKAEGTFIYKVCQKVVTRYMKGYANGCDMVFAPSLDMREHLSSLGVTVPVRTLPTGLSPESFVKDEIASRKIRKKYKGDKKYLFCTVSRIEKEKNLYFLMDSVRKLKEEMGDVFRLMVVGAGGERETLTSYVEREGLTDHVVFTGGVPNGEVKNYLFASDLFLFSSKSETQGIVLSEAMAAGLPVAAVSAYGVNDIVKEGENGLLCEEQEEAFAKNVEKIMADQDLYERLKIGAKETANHYRETEIAKQAEADYEYACGQMYERRGLYGYREYGQEAAKPSLLRLFKIS